MERTLGIYPRLGFVAFLVIFFDQVTKSIALLALEDGPISVIEGALTLRLTYNSGGAFGIMQGLPGFFMLATIVVVGVVLYWARGLTDPRWAIPLGLVLGGGLGNVADRIFRDTNGRVVDFVDLHVWPVFNLADSCIVAGVLILIVMTARAPRAHAEP